MRKRSSYRPRPVKVPVMAGTLAAFRDALTTAEIGMRLAPGEYHFDAMASVAEIVRIYVVDNEPKIEPHVMRQFTGALRTMHDLAAHPTQPTTIQLETLHIGRQAMLEIISKADIVGLEIARQKARQQGEDK